MQHQSNTFCPGDKLKDQIIQFVTYVQPKQLNRNLKKLLLWYLMYEDEEPVFDLKELLTDLVLLFELLDAAEDEYMARKCNEM